LKKDSEIRKKLFTSQLKGDTIPDKKSQEAEITGFLKTVQTEQQTRRSTMKQYLIDTNEMTMAEVVNSKKAADEKTDDIIVVVSKEEDLNQFNMADLKKLHKAIEAEGKATAKKDLVPLIWAKLSEGAKKEVKVTKTSLLRGAFASKKKWNQGDLLAATGYDVRNLTTALAILRNANRTKKEDMLNVDYDKDKKTYTLIGKAAK